MPFRIMVITFDSDSKDNGSIPLTVTNNTTKEKQMKEKSTPICMCKTCGKSKEVEGSECLYEETEKMAYCSSWIRRKATKK